MKQRVALFLFTRTLAFSGIESISYEIDRVLKWQSYEYIDDFHRYAQLF